MPVCKLCFKEFENNNFSFLINQSNHLCTDCFNKFELKFQRKVINKIEVVSLYPYDQNIKSTIYQFKGCNDYELKDIFLERFKTFLRLKYHKYELILIPSSNEDNLRRGFNHLEAMVEILKIKRINYLFKSITYKQSDQLLNKRVNIFKVLNYNPIDLKGKKILIFDDVMTTGNTIKAAIELIKKGKPKKIKVLIFASNCRIEEVFGEQKKYKISG